MARYKKKYNWYDLSRFRTLGAAFTLIGTIIGAGVIGIPSVISQSGFWTGMTVMFVIFLISLLIYLCMGEIVLRTKGKHQLPGYAGIYLGSFGKKLMSITMMFTIYGGLVAYIIAAGESLYDLFKGVLPLNSFMYSMIFFAVMSGIIYFGINVLKDSEIAVSSLLIMAVLLIFILAAPNIHTTNYTGFSMDRIFMPMGVILFAFLGFVGVPEASEVIGHKKHRLKTSILVGVTVPLLIFIVFTIAIVGIKGNSVSELGTMGLYQILGYKGWLLGNLFLIFAVSTSFLGTAFALKESFYFDLKLTNFKAWALTCAVPLVSYFVVSNFASFTDILNISGILFGGIEAILIVLILLAAKKSCARRPEFSIPINHAIAGALIAFIAAGAVSLLFPF